MRAGRKVLVVVRVIEVVVERLARCPIVEPARAVLQPVLQPQTLGRAVPPEVHPQERVERGAGSRLSLDLGLDLGLDLDLDLDLGLSWLCVCARAPGVPPAPDEPGPEAAAHAPTAIATSSANPFTHAMDVALRTVGIPVTS